MSTRQLASFAYDANINEGLGFTPALAKKCSILTGIRRLYQSRIDAIAQELRVIDGSLNRIREEGENKAVPDAMKHLRAQNERKVVQDVIETRRQRHLVLQDLKTQLWPYKKALEPLEERLDITVPAYARSSCLALISKIFILPRELRDTIYGYLLDAEMLPQMHKFFHDRDLNGLHHDWCQIQERPCFLNQVEFANPQFVYEAYEHAQEWIQEHERDRQQKRFRKECYKHYKVCKSCTCSDYRLPWTLAHRGSDIGLNTMEWFDSTGLSGS